MERTKFGATWDNAMPGLQEMRLEIDTVMFDSLTFYFEDCIEPGGFLRAVLENDLSGAVARMHASLPPLYLVVVVRMLYKITRPRRRGAIEKKSRRGWNVRNSEEQTTMATKILFHSFDGIKHCADGFTAAWAAWRFFGDDAQYIPCVYGQDPPSIEDGDMVYLLDFSYPRAILEDWLNRASVRILDHHKTADAELKGLPDDVARFDMNLSGAQLAWQEFRGAGEPPLVQYVADRDLWRKKLPASDEVNLALGLFPQNFETWDALYFLEHEYAPFMSRIGEPLLRERNVAIEAVASCAQIVEWHGHTAGAIWTQQGELVSDALNLICRQHPEVDFAFNVEVVDGGFRYNFRSVGEFDVSEIAKAQGGGGHRNAAGCVVKREVAMGRVAS